MRIDEALRWAQKQLIDSESALLDSQVLLAFVLNKETVYLLTWPERELNKAQLEHFNTLIGKRMTGYPVAHLTGHREFWSLPLQVNNSTLIPRPDTEVLVEAVLEKVSQRPQLNNSNILDLGTGSGAIILALATELPKSNCLGVDTNEQAVLLAQQNCKNLQLANVSIKRSNWFSEVQGRFEIIVSNPPYIDAQDTHLQEGDLRFEPLSALVAEQHGLADFRKICEQATTHLAVDGYLIFEHGFEQGDAVQIILKENGFSNIETRQDYAGNDRVTLGILSNFNN